MIVEYQVWSVNSHCVMDKCKTLEEARKEVKDWFKKIDLECKIMKVVYKEIK